MLNEVITNKKIAIIFKSLSRTHKLGVLLLVSILAVGYLLTPIVRADIFDEQINVLNQDNSAKAQAKAQLGAEAASLSDAIAKLQAQIDTLQAQINANQAKRDDLQRQIVEAEIELQKQRTLLGKDIKQMYLDGQISTLEMLASSQNLSDFVDKQQYLSTVQKKIRSTLDKITELKHQLKAQKDEIEKLLLDQKAMQSQLDAQRTQQNQILSLNQAQQGALNDAIKANKSKISDLRKQQITENARLFNGATVILGQACDTAHGDTYPSPWCSSAQDSMIDSWGMYNRECVSYTAWKVSESGRHMPYWGGIGNANQWDDNAIAAGISVNTNPRAGDVAIKNSLPYGHSMYVESVNGDGTINITQYNSSLDGRFSRAYNVSAGGLVFIHF